MYLSYIDGSGRPEKNCEPKESYALASLITHESQWIYIDNKVKEIKLKHFPQISDEDIELHAKDMQNRTGIFKGLEWTKIYAILDDIFDFLTLTAQFLG